MATATDDETTEEEEGGGGAPRVPRRRPMAAGHAILVVFIAFGVGTLLNANKMMHTAESLPLGSTKREIAVDVMRPIQWVSNHLGITEPHTLMDHALGKSTKHVADPFSEFTGSTTPSPTVRGGRAATTSTARRGTVTTRKPGTKTTPSTIVARFHPSAKRPLRVYVAGDSLSAEYGYAMARLAASDPNIEMEGSVDYHVASGLARPDFFNWPLELDQQIKARKPDVVIFLAGANDDQAMQQPNGKTYRPYELGWSYEYSRRAAALMDQVNRSGCFMVWVGIPPIRNVARSHGYQLMDSLVNTQARVRPDVRFINPYTMFLDKNGNYQQYLPNPQGQLVKMRADDGIHFERAGGDLLASVTARLLARLYPPTRAR